MLEQKEQRKGFAMLSTRRQFLSSSALAAPFILAPGCATGFTANRRVNLAVIGYGRIAHTMDVPRMLKYTDLCRFVAVCDIDSKRRLYGKKCIEKAYAKRGIAHKVAVYADYNEMVKDPAIDAVLICTPDHQHALHATACLLAKKHIYLQKPFAQTIQEGRLVANLAQMYKRVVQVGSWQRSRPQFHRVCELVRNGRLGKIARVEVGIGLDKAGGCRTPEPVPANLDYDAWLGPTDPTAPYNWTRVHNQNLARIGDRPGWIQLAPYGWGMITNWGAHHIDVASWGLGGDATSVRGTCEWMDQSGNKLWNVHTTYDLHFACCGADVHVKNTYQMGVKFIGENGDWLWCTRGAMKVTPSDPEPKVRPGMLGPIAASKPSLMEPMADPAVPLHTAADHFLNFLEAVAADDPSHAVTCAEGGHRSTAFCSLGQMCMELSRGRKDGASLSWDARRETTGSAEADKMMTPFARGKYDLRNPVKAAGLDYEKLIRPLA
jgi:predicted dehydrogenase